MRTLECKTLDEVRGRRLLGEGHLSDRGRLVEEIRSVSITCNFFPEQTLSDLKYLMTSCQFDTVNIQFQDYSTIL